MRIFEKKDPNHQQPLMPRTATSFFSSAPGTSQLEVPKEIQRPQDFESTQTDAPQEEDSTTSDQALDLSRLRGYTLPRSKKKKQRSFVWKHGWRLLNSEGKDYWLCRLCHCHPLRPSMPVGHIFVASHDTSSAITHLREHGIRSAEDVASPEPRGSKRQASIAGFTASSRSAPTEEFDYEVFKGLLLQLFTTRSLPFNLIEDRSFRSLLAYANPLLSDSVPSRRTLRRWIESTYNEALVSVETQLQRANTKINLSFDLWSSPNRRLSLLGVVAHYLDEAFKPRVVLLALPCLQESHTAVNIAAQLSSLLRHFKIDEKSFGNAVTDNASENAACLALLGDELCIDTAKRHVRCVGHVINLVAQQVLFGKDVDSFELSLTDVTAEEVELQSWRRKGPIGRLHNLIRYICHSTNRRELFLQIQREQPDALRSERLSARQAYELIFDNTTRWNSWYDAAERALDLRHAIDDFVDLELAEYHQRLARYNRRASESQGVAPKAPSLTLDRLGNNDWHIIASYVKLLKPLKSATMRLQGNVDTASVHGAAIKGAIWQVLPVYEEILRAFEEARERHPPESSLSTSQSTEIGSQLALQARPTPTSQGVRNTRRSKPQASSPTSDLTEDSAASFEPALTVLSDDASLVDLENHFSTNINAGWQKLEFYYNHSDLTPIHRAAVLLHPRMKWRWFKRYWSSRPTWIADARAAIAELWAKYKNEPNEGPTSSTPPPTALQDEWSTSSFTNDMDELQQYEQEAPSVDLLAFESPIPYWVGKRKIWPRLARMALDVYSTPAMSDEPERVFSIAGNTLAPRRRCLTSQVMQWLMCLRS